MRQSFNIITKCVYTKENGLYNQSFISMKEFLRTSDEVKCLCTDRYNKPNT